jgi:hypothetical protein
MLMGILFLALPYSEVTHDYFPLADQQITLQMHIWFICNKVVFIIFAYIIYNEATEYRNALNVFLWIQILKLIDYSLCYNNVWVRVWDTVPFSSTTLGILVFSLAIFYEWIWKK